MQALGSSSPCSPTMTSIARKSSSGNVCAVCNAPTEQRCSGCHLMYYCGKPHITQDWKWHKQTCKILQDTSLSTVNIPMTIPAPANANTFEAIVFPASDETPRMVTITWEWADEGDGGVTWQKKHVGHLFRQGALVREQLVHFPYRGAAALPDDRCLVVNINDNFLNDGSPLNRSIFKLTGGKAKHQWSDNVIALRQRPEDMVESRYHSANLEEDLDVLKSYFLTYGYPAQRDVIITHNVNDQRFPTSRRDPMEMLMENVAFGALHNSAERYDPPKCHPNTRTAILNSIDQWARDKSRNAKPVIWLTGAAGAGKSAIAQTMIERWKSERLMLASFFFWRTSPERNQKTRLFPTIAFQLSKLIPTARAAVEETIQAGSIFRQTLKSQLEELIVDPLDSVHTSRPIVIVIDGLDECCVDLPGQDHEAQQREILEALAFACGKTTSLRFLIASRPERQIRQSFNAKTLQEMTFVVSLQNAPDVQADIRLFLECSFEEIKQTYPALPSSWPSRDQISILVSKSSGQFIYPSIVIKFISAPREDPVQRLLKVLNLEPRSEAGQEGYPLAELDALYCLILGSIASRSRSVVKDVLGYLCYPKMLLAIPKGSSSDSEPLTSLESIAGSFYLSITEILNHLTDLYSLLDVPSPRRASAPLKFMHATLPEYLTDDSRSGEFFIDAETIFLQQSCVLLRHVEEHHLRGSSSFYATFELNDMLEVCALRAPCSADLMHGLWKLMKVILGAYPTASSSTDSRRMSVDYLDVYTKFEILRYLIACNIPQIEPSEQTRAMVFDRLKAPMLCYTGLKRSEDNSRKSECMEKEWHPSTFGREIPGRRYFLCNREPNVSIKGSTLGSAQYNRSPYILPSVNSSREHTPAPSVSPMSTPPVIPGSDYHIPSIPHEVGNHVPVGPTMNNSLITSLTKRLLQARPLEEGEGDSQSRKRRKV